MRKEQKKKLNSRARRLNRTRKSIVSNSMLPRLSVFRSLKHFYLQLIDDKAGNTICSASDAEIKETKGKKPLEIAAEIGHILGEKAVAKKVTKIVFDRGAYKYHGKVKAAADAVRKAGLEF